MAIDGGLEFLAEAGTVTTPGWPDIEALRSAHRRGTRLLARCSGCVVLAASGFLDGKRMTAHWRFAAQVQQHFPRKRADPHVRGSLGPLLKRMRRRLHEPTANARVAEQAAMSERTFIRRYHAAAGMTPAGWCPASALRCPLG